MLSPPWCHIAVAGLPLITDFVPNSILHYCFLCFWHTDHILCWLLPLVVTTYNLCTSADTDHILCSSCTIYKHWSHPEYSHYWCASMLDILHSQIAPLLTSWTTFGTTVDTDHWSYHTLQRSYADLLHYCSPHWSLIISYAVSDLTRTTYPRLSFVSRSPSFSWASLTFL